MNIYQIAEKAGVSIATVSRVLNDSPSVSPKTREKVLQIMEQDHYHPNVFARGLMLDSMKLVGVICTDVSDSFIAEALSLLQAQLRTRSYDMLLFSVGSNQETTAKHLRYLQNKHVDAIFLIGSTFSDTADRQKLCRIAQEIPVIMINGFVDAPGVYCVCSDDTATAARIVDTMCRRGLTDCVMLYDSMTQGTRRKMQGMQQALAQNGIVFTDRHLVLAGETLQTSAAAVEQLIAEGHCPDAVLATSDLLAAGAIKAFAKHGLQRGVVGFDNTVLCDCLVPGLTSVDQHMDCMCETAARIMDQLLQNQQPKQFFTCPSEIIWRESFPE
ncbi:MAG: LacI family DNA-binding transcriptional regulator [Oscillospiraceae bacterium]|nr:LacI family DNA-binding transcriptional regulator [Oscillospiraceae bacterium]